MASYRYERDIDPKDIAPRKERQYTRKERWANWWDYNLKWVILIGIAVAFAAYNFIGQYFFTTKPDYNVAVVAPYYLPDDTVTALQEQLARYGEDLNGDGKISYAMFKGDEANVEAIYRTQFGVEDADAVLTAAGKPALEYFDASNTDKYQVDQDGNWSATAANNYMTTNLSQYNESAGNMIELVICNNDGMAEGVISALNDKGYNLGDGNCTTIPVFGVDATDAAKQLIADGKMTGTIKQDAEGMANGIAYLAKNIQAGKDLMADTDSFNISEKVSNKIYIPYATYTGE